MRKTIVAMLTAFAVVAAGCGGGDSLSENLAENIIENAGGDNVNVDISGEGDDAEVKIETDEGSISIGGGDIPEELSVAVPDGGDVLSSIAMDTGISVVVSWPGSEFDALVSFYESWTAEQSGEFERQSSTFESGGDTYRNVGWYSSDADVTISVGDCPGTETGELDSACVTITEAK